MDINEALNLLKDKLQSWIEGFILILPNFLIAVAVIALAHYAARTSRQLVKRVLQKFVDNQALVNFLGILTQVAVFLIGFLIAIKILSLDEAVFSVLAGVGIAGLAIGFAFQDVAANFIAGIALVFRKDHPFKVGDIVETNGQMGTIREISLRDTMLETFDGQSIFIPNKMIFENAVQNYSLLGRRRIDLAVGISYGDDLEKVKKVTVEALQNIENRVESRDVELFFEEFGNSSINFEVRFWVPFVRQTDYLKARSEAVMAIKKAYNENDITIPFPIRTLDFGIKGGEKLSAMLSDRKN